MNVKSKCTIPANHFEYFIMGAKYHYSPPVQSTPVRPTATVHSARSSLARTPREFVGDRALRACTRMEGDRDRSGGTEKEGMASHYAWKEDGRGTRGTQKCLGRGRGRGRKRNVCGNARGGRELTRVSAGRGGTRGTLAYIQRAHTRSARGETHARGGQNGESGYERERARYGVCDRD